MTNLDEALERFHLADLEYAGGRGNHGPMGATALECLGHQALIPAFLDLYVPRLPPASVGEVMTDAESDAAVGRPERRGDWVATYAARLESGDWRSVVSEALPNLIPGVFAGAGLGLLRTAYAIRNLESEDDSIRRRELAVGLAYWSARYHPLPGLPGSRAGLADGPGSKANIEAFFRNLACLGEPALRAGFFFESVGRLEADRDFGEAIETIARPSDSCVEQFLETLSRVAARLYCAHPESRVVYVHALAIPVALSGMLEYFDSSRWPQIKGQAALYGLQAVAALHALYGERFPEEGVERVFDGDLEVQAMSKNWDEIRYRAACSIQEHAILMVEACLRAHRRDADPVYSTAAADAALHIEGSGTAASSGAGGC